LPVQILLEQVQDIILLHINLSKVSQIQMELKLGPHVIKAILEVIIPIKEDQIIKVYQWVQLMCRQLQFLITIILCLL
jgi:hypothetical protein